MIKYLYSFDYKILSHKKNIQCEKNIFKEKFNKTKLLYVNNFDNRVIFYKFLCQIVIVMIVLFWMQYLFPEKLEQIKCYYISLIINVI